MNELMRQIYPNNNSARKGNIVNTQQRTTYPNIRTYPDISNSFQFPIPQFLCPFPHLHHPSPSPHPHHESRMKAASQDFIEDFGRAEEKDFFLSSFSTFSTCLRYIYNWVLSISHIYFLLYICTLVTLKFLQILPGVFCKCTADDPP